MAARRSCWVQTTLTLFEAFTLILWWLTKWPTWTLIYGTACLYIAWRIDRAGR